MVLRYSLATQKVRKDGRHVREVRVVDREQGNSVEGPLRRWLRRWSRSVAMAHSVMSKAR